MCNTITPNPASSSRIPASPHPNSTASSTKANLDPLLHAYHNGWNPDNWNPDGTRKNLNIRPAGGQPFPLKRGKHYLAADYKDQPEPPEEQPKQPAPKLARKNRVSPSSTSKAENVHVKGKAKTSTPTAAKAPAKAKSIKRPRSSSTPSAESEESWTPALKRAKSKKVTFSSTPKIEKAPTKVQKKKRAPATSKSSVDSDSESSRPLADLARIRFAKTVPGMEEDELVETGGKVKKGKGKEEGVQVGGIVAGEEVEEKEEKAKIAVEVEKGRAGAASEPKKKRGEQLKKRTGKN